jgi:hypothetical protein
LKRVRVFQFGELPLPRLVDWAFFRSQVAFAARICSLSSGGFPRILCGN